MTFTKSLWWGAVAVAIALFAAVGLLVTSPTSTAHAAAPTAVNVIIVDTDDSIPQPTGTATTLRVVVDVDDGAAAVNEVQTVTVSIAACDTAGDTYTLTFNAQTTAAITCDTATNAIIQAALEGLAGIAVGDVSVGGLAAAPGAATLYTFTVTFTGTYAGTDVALITGTQGVDTGADGADPAAVETTAGAGGGGATDETIVALTTSVGTWASSGTTQASVQCAQDAANLTNPAVVDVGDENVTTSITIGTYNNTAEVGDNDEDNEAAEEGCLAIEDFLLVPVGAATGTYAITAQTTNGVSGLENLTIVAGTGTTPAGITAVSQSHDAIGFTTSGTFEPLVNGTLWTVRVTDASANGVNGTQVQFSTDNGVLIDASNGTQDGGTDDTNTEAEILAACASTGSLGQSIIGVTETQGTSSTAAGRVRVVLCGRSGDAGTTANLTARTLGSSQFSVSDAVTVGGKPSSSDIVLSQSGGIVTATVMVGGVPAADDLDVRWTVIPTDTAVVTPTCSSLHDGTATTTAATTGAAPATIVATVTDNDVECDATPIRTDGSAQLALGAGGTTPPAGTAFTGTVPARGSIGLLVIRGTQTAPGLVVAFGTAGCPVESLAVLRVGRWLIYINGAPVVVNAAFPASLEDLTPFFVRCAA